MANYSTLLCFDSMLSYNTSVQNNIFMTTAKQNQKFPFHFFFRFAVEGWGEETREKCKEIFWFLHTRVRERVRGAFVRFTTQSERTERFRATTRSARAISRQNPADFVRSTFELRPIHTAHKNNHQHIAGGCFSLTVYYAPASLHVRQFFLCPIKRTTAEAPTRR